MCIALLFYILPLYSWLVSFMSLNPWGEGMSVSNPCISCGDSTWGRVGIGPEKPGKSWNFIVAFSRTQESPGKRLLDLESSGNL